MKYIKMTGQIKDNCGSVSACGLSGRTHKVLLYQSFSIPPEFSTSAVSLRGFTGNLNNDISPTFIILPNHPGVTFAGAGPIPCDTTFDGMVYGQAKTRIASTKELFNPDNTSPCTMLNAEIACETDPFNGKCNVNTQCATDERKVVKYTYSVDMEMFGQYDEYPCVDSHINMEYDTEDPDDVSIIFNNTYAARKAPFLNFRSCTVGDPCDENNCGWPGSPIPLKYKYQNTIDVTVSVENRPSNTVSSYKTLKSSDCDNECASDCRKALGYPIQCDCIPESLMCKNNRFGESFPYKDFCESAGVSLQGTLLYTEQTPMIQRDYCSAPECFYTIDDINLVTKVFNPIVQPRYDICSDNDSLIVCESQYEQMKKDYAELYNLSLESCWNKDSKEISKIIDYCGNSINDCAKAVKKQVSYEAIELTSIVEPFPMSIATITSENRWETYQAQPENFNRSIFDAFFGAPCPAGGTLTTYTELSYINIPKYSFTMTVTTAFCEVTYKDCDSQ